MTRLLALVTALLAASTAAADDEKFTLKLYSYREGDVYKVTKTTKTEVKSEYTIGEKSGKDELKKSEELVYTVEMLTKPADARLGTKSQRTYEKVVKKDTKGEVKSALSGKTQGHFWFEVGELGRWLPLVVRESPPCRSRSLRCSTPSSTPAPTRG